VLGSPGGALRLAGSRAGVDQACPGRRPSAWQKKTSKPTGRHPTGHSFPHSYSQGKVTIRDNRTYAITLLFHFIHYLRRHALNSGLFLCVSMIIVRVSCRFTVIHRGQRQRPTRLQAVTIEAREMQVPAFECGCVTGKWDFHLSCVSVCVVCASWNSDMARDVFARGGIDHALS
jgi:hypothetical protein